MNKTVSFFKISYLNLKLLLIDNASVILSIILGLFTLIFSCIFLAVKTTGEFVTYYNYFFLFLTGAFWIIITMRIVFLFLYSKIEDKTIYIIAMQKVSRIKMITSQIFVMILFLFCLAIINFTILNTFSAISFKGINKVVIKTTTSHLFYLFIISFCLVMFFTFLALMLKTQIATIIITLLLALTFIGNLPYQFLTTSEKNKTITFENPNTTALDPQSVSDVYAAFDLQKNITTNNIKYSHLSNYINNFLVEENKFNSSDYSSTAGQTIRKNFWDSLGIVKQGPFSHSYILKTSSVPRSVSEKETGIKVGDEVSLEFDLDYTFITLDELNNLINSSSSSRNINYDVLKELQEFTVNLMKEYSNNQNQFQIRYYPFFGELISIENGVLRNTQEEDPNIMFNYQIQNLQNSYAANFKEYQDNNETYRFQTSGQSQLLFESELSLNSSGKYTGLYSPLYFAIRVLEQYFIKYTSNYVKYTTFYTRTSFDDFKDYKKSRDLFNTQYLINPISNLFSVYTYYAGVSPDDIWFNPIFDSVIDLHEQENMFLGYSTYELKFIRDSSGKLIIVPDTYNNIIQPWIFILVQLLGAISFYVLSIWIYSRRDIV